jgi:hypothetical protein
MLKTVYFYLLLLFSLSFLVAGEQYIHHELEVLVKPNEQFIKVVDNLVIPQNMTHKETYFLLHGNLNVSVSSSKIKIEMVNEQVKSEYFGIEEDKLELPEDIPYNLYKISSPNINGTPLEFSIFYEGIIHHPVKQISKEYARGFSQTPGIISEKGAYLAGGTYWLPWFNHALVTFNMNVTIDPTWKVISQGKRVKEDSTDESYKVRWESPEPMDEIFLIAGPFTEYSKQIGNVSVLAVLRTPDQSLANKYLETTAQYLEMYRQLIGTYPYSKFALVENFWETGYGMPSFTLLGEKVIRFPFILHSSYPHELLHNWWGNSVFVDYETGNWCEGLTAYMADHLIKEQRGQGAEYRRGSLQAYTDYVNDDNEFPLSEFISRSDAASSSIGYNKSMMLFNMLRLDVGDENFTKAFQQFYRENKFRRAGFADIKTAFESVTGNNFGPFFDHWVKHKGAPVLKVSDAKSIKQEDGYQCSFKLIQSQKGEAYQLAIPVAVYFEGEDAAKIETVKMTKKEERFNLNYKNRPVVIDVDPQFDVFRRLDRNEIPPSLSQVFGSDKITIVLPGAEESNRLTAYEKLAQSWASSEPEKIKIVKDEELDAIPADRAVWIFGRSNKFKETVVESLSDYSITITEDKYQIGKGVISPAKNSVILATRNPKNPEFVIIWLSADNDAAMPGLGRKLPHYGKYSYLAFEGDEPTNILKGQWPAVNSPMSTQFSYDDFNSDSYVKGKLPDRQALANLAPVFSEERMLSHVQNLANEEMQGRGLGSEGLDKAADYIAAEFKKAGLKPGGNENSYFQSWQETGGIKNKDVTLRNVIGIIPGKKPEFEGQSVVVCAHYDHLGLGWPDIRKGNEGKIHYGADDNASGVSVLLELANLFVQGAQPDRTIIFIALSGEESGLRGSKYYVKNSKKYPANKIIGVLNLDTVGRLGENKMLILNSSSASEWKHIAMGVGFVTGLGYELVSEDLDASDQVSFIKAGVPAIQLFSGPNRDYHRPTDQVEKIDPAGMVKIATFSREVITYLAEREDPMTFAGSNKTDKNSGARPGGRKVGSGIMPDFAFQGNGVKAADVAAESPAAKAGLQKGDVIIKLGDQSIGNLKDYSNALKTYKPGDTTAIIYKRGEEELKSEITLQER